MLSMKRLLPEKKHYEAMVVGHTDHGEHQYRLYEINLATWKRAPLCGHVHESKSAAKCCQDAMEARARNN